MKRLENCVRLQPVSMMIKKGRPGWFRHGEHKTNEDSLYDVGDLWKLADGIALRTTWKILIWLYRMPSIGINVERK